MTTSASNRDMGLGRWLLLSMIGVYLISESAEAQVIQLPTYRNFSMSGGVVVPDSGTGYLGGFGSSFQGSNSRGGPLMSNRGIGGNAGAGGISISVDIIDLDALDQAILSANLPLNVVQSTASSRSSSAADDADQARRFISGYRSVSSTNEPLDYRDFHRSLTSRPQVPGEDQDSMAESNIRYYLKKGQEAENANRIQSARVFYRMARDAMTPQLLERYQRILTERDEAQKTQARDANPKRRPF